MVKIQKISAIALTVSDVDRSTDFYTQALGFKSVSDVTFAASSYSKLATISDSKVRIVTLQMGDEYIELIQYVDLEAKSIPEDSQSNDLWFQHFAIVVSDMDRAYKHLKEFAIEHISTEPQTIPKENKLGAGIRAFKFRDSDRHALELIWFPPDKSKPKWQENKTDLFMGIDHSAISVTDTEQSAKFYRDLLGMEKLEGPLNQGQVQADLDGLPVAQVQVTPLDAVEDGIGVEFLDYIKPGTGRSVPRDWQIDHLSHMHYIAEVENIESSFDELRQQGVNVVSPSVIQFPESYRYQQGYLIRDSDEHSLLLVNTKD